MSRLDTQITGHDGGDHLGVRSVPPGTLGGHHVGVNLAHSRADGALRFPLNGTRAGWCCVAGTGQRYKNK